MKNRLTLLFFCLLILSCGKKEVKKENNEFKEPEIEQTIPKVNDVQIVEIEKEVVPKLIYTVQIAALKNNNEDLLSLDGIKTYDEDALTKYRLGNFKTYEQARVFRAQILKEYKDAFVQALKNETPISITEALQN